MGLLFWILSFFMENPGLFAAFKMEHRSVYASVIFFGFLYSPISALVSSVSNIFSRRHELQADRYASRHTGAAIVDHPDAVGVDGDRPVDEVVDGERDLHGPLQVLPTVTPVTIRARNSQLGPPSAWVVSRIHM